jgi:heterotetrameric sarcosine oxidase gamma subunit
MSYQVDIQSRTLDSLFDIRSDARNLKILIDSVNLPLPEIPHCKISSGNKDVIRLGPKRCLLRAPVNEEAKLEVELQEKSNKIFANATCISDMYHAIKLAGNDVLQVLSQVTPLNLYTFEIGAATATEIFSLSGFLVHEDNEIYTVYIESSYGDYVLERLQKCALRE